MRNQGSNPCWVFTPQWKVTCLALAVVTVNSAQESMVDNNCIEVVWVNMDSMAVLEEREELRNQQQLDGGAGPV